MPRRLSSIMVFLCFSWGCTVIDDTVDSESAPPQMAVAFVPEKIDPPAPAAESEKTSPPRTEQTAISPVASKERIRDLQLVLETSGFDPGPVNGMLGNRTKTAFLRLESSCGALSDLLESPELERLLSSASRKAPSDIRAGDARGKNRIRLLQVRLKDAGFDPGTIDGIAGANTIAAVHRFRSGCTGVKNFSPALKALVREKAGEEAGASDLKAALLPGNNSAATERPEGAVLQAAPSGAAIENEVRVLQLRLKAAGFDPGPIDGIMGAKTKSALDKFKASRGTSMTAMQYPAGTAAVQH